MSEKDGCPFCGGRGLVRVRTTEQAPDGYIMARCNHGKVEVQVSGVGGGCTPEEELFDAIAIPVIFLGLIAMLFLGISHLALGWPA